LSGCNLPLGDIVELGVVGRFAWNGLEWNYCRFGGYKREIRENMLLWITSGIGKKV